MADTLSLCSENSDRYLKEIVSRLSGKTFNILTVSDGKRLKYCKRELRGSISSKNGQASIPLKPGGSIAWDLNVETVELEFGTNGDILLSRIFKSGRKKTILITQSPI